MHLDGMIVLIHTWRHHVEEPSRKQLLRDHLPLQTDRMLHDSTKTHTNMAKCQCDHSRVTILLVLIAKDKKLEQADFWTGIFQAHKENVLSIRGRD